MLWIAATVPTQVVISPRTAAIRRALGSSSVRSPYSLYRQNSEWGSRVLEQVIFESSVDEDAVGESWRVLYTDRITQAGLTHEYRCRQHLTINPAGKIANIVHEELPGEREAG